MVDVLHSKWGIGLAITATRLGTSLGIALKPEVGEVVVEHVITATRLVILPVIALKSDVEVVVGEVVAYVTTALKVDTLQENVPKSAGQVVVVAVVNPSVINVKDLVILLENAHQVVKTSVTDVGVEGILPAIVLSQTLESEVDMEGWIVFIMANQLTWYLIAPMDESFSFLTASDVCTEM